MANSSKGTKQVNPATPKQRVQSTFGGKGALVDAILSLIGDDGSSRSKLMQVSNDRLIKHHHSAKRMSAKFGSKDSLVDAIVAVRYGTRTPDEGAREALEASAVWRLMDLHRQAVDIETSAKKAAAVDAKAKAARAKRRAKVRAARAAR